jgi:hypothetical protein
MYIHVFPKTQIFTFAVHQVPMLLRVGARVRARPVGFFPTISCVSHVNTYAKQRIKVNAAARALSTPRWSASEERAVALFSELRTARNQAEFNRAQEAQAQDEKANQRADKVLLCLREQILDGKGFLGYLEKGVTKFPVSVPWSSFGSTDEERQLTLSKMLIKLFPDVAGNIQGSTDAQCVNAHKFIPGFRITVPPDTSMRALYSYSGTPPVRFFVSLCDSRPVGALLRASVWRMFASAHKMYKKHVDAKV